MEIGGASWKWTARMLYFLVFLTTVSPCLGDDIYTANSPYKGRVLGSGGEIKVVPSELAEALNITAEETPDGWSLAGVAIKVVMDSGAAWVKVSDLPADVFKVLRNSEFATIDIFLADGVRKKPGKSWATEGTLVVFYANYSPACRAMDRTLEDLILSDTIQVDVVDIDFPEEQNYRKHVRKFRGDKVPYFVVLNTKGREIHNFTGFHNYSDLLKELTTAFSK